jgi:hypothetical protein
VDLLNGSIIIPNVVFVPGLIVVLLGLLWTYSLVRDRNPLPFSDRDYHVVSTSSLTRLIALEELMQRFGHAPRFRIDSDQVDRTVFTNGTIINFPHPDMLARLDDPAAALGFVVPDFGAAAREAAEVLRRCGFRAEIVLDAEPGLPITFVKTDALKNAALVFRTHVLKMGQKPPRWTPRENDPLRRPGPRQTSCDRSSRDIVKSCGSG